MKKRYRPNVAAILQRADGRVLLAQRSDYPESWQFPQGGVDRGESPDEAVRREVLEEVGLSPATYSLGERRGPYRYDFPHGCDRRGFHGQEQWYFLGTLHAGPAPTIDLTQTCGEFLAVRWVELATFPIASVPPMKQDVYRAVLQDLLEWSDDSH